MALKTLKLDQVWWLVSPQNPLKPVKGMAPLANRLAAARSFGSHPRILVTDIEARLGTVYTADTLAALALRYPRTRFVWLMGADNLVQIRHWRRWQTIFGTVPVAVYDRPGYDLLAGGSLAARRFARFRRHGLNQTGLARQLPPAWTFFHTPLKAISSTALRNKLSTEKA